MPFEIRKISDVGTGHPVVARLGVQAADLIEWLDLDKAGRETLTHLYLMTLTQRLLRCHEIFDTLVQKIVVEDQKITAAKETSRNSDVRVRHVPHVTGLQGYAEGFLYEAKNFLRDLLTLFQVAYGCDIKEASAFTNLRGSGDSDLVKWAIATLGSDNHLTELLKTEQTWVAQFVRMRNAIEHPGGYSGTVTLQNCRAHPDHVDGYIPPTWQCTGCEESDIAADMETGLHNMLTLAEELLAHAVMHKAKAEIAIYEIAKDERDPNCPVRLRVGPSAALAAKIRGLP